MSVERLGGVGADWGVVLVRDGNVDGGQGHLAVPRGLAGLGRGANGGPGTRGIGDAYLMVDVDGGLGWNLVVVPVRDVG